jgi:hypothetical protein
MKQEEDFNFRNKFGWFFRFIFLVYCIMAQDKLQDRFEKSIGDISKSNKKLAAICLFLAMILFAIIFHFITYYLFGKDFYDEFMF